MAIIVGLSAYYHDSACCVLHDGKLIAAAQEERFSRRKHDNRLPKNAFRYCLDEASVGIDEITCIAYYENPMKKLARQLWANADTLSEEKLVKLWGACRRPMDEIREFLGYDGLIEIFDHHQCHAASSYYYSGFKDAAILTIDGVGEWASTTYGIGHDKEIVLCEEVDFPDSLGLLYSTITGYLGFDVNDGEYKVMGLAPYGRPVFAEKIRALVKSEPNGQYRLDLEKFDFVSAERMFSDTLPSYFGMHAREAGSVILSFHEDIAKSLQIVLEELLLEKTAYLHERSGSDNLCMAGGVALNCVANGRIAREGKFKALFIQPAAGDAGTALGAAALAHLKHVREWSIDKQMAHVNWGPAYTNQDVCRAVASIGRPSDFQGREQQLLDKAVERLVAGKVVGWFQGRMEFGPRALGARSILADPRLPSMRDLINSRIKKREEFRPFAPAVLEEKADEHFDLRHPSPFMLETCQVKSALELPAITHVDGSARVQTVASDSNPRFARLLKTFETKTGCPLLLNTSFNMSDEPIVCTPVDALICFLRSNIEALVIEDFIIDRENLNPISSHVLSWLYEGQGRKSNVSHLVYTFE